jgi:hypothetical protein
MPDIAEIVVRDYDNTLTTMKMNTVDLTAGNLAAQLAALATLVADTTPIIRGVVAESRLKIITPGTSILPASEEAQVEKGWLVTYTDSSQFLDPGTDLVPNPGFGLLFTMTIPTAEYTGHLALNTDFADLADADVAAFVTAFEALFVSPYGGDTVIQTIRVSGVDA